MAKSMEKNLECSICFEIFKDPLVLHCSHSFCKECLERTWSLKMIRECPLCRHVTKRTPFKNLVLKDMCESFVEEKRRRISAESQGVLCDVHGLKYELFCTNDQKVVCLSCVSQDHKTHNFCTIDKAAEEHKNKLQKPLQELESKLQTITSKKSSLSTLASKLKSQETSTKLQITKEFSKLHQFLTKEEEARLAAVKDEQNKNRERIMEKTREVDKLHTFLSERIKIIKDDLRCDESLFLKNFKDTEARVNITPPDLPQFNLVSVIDVAKHTGNLSYIIWEKMKSICPSDPQILHGRTTIPYRGPSNLTTMPSVGVNLLNSPSPLE